MDKLKVAEVKCPDCKNGGKILEDPRAGRVVCQQCGIVLDTQFISDQSEWRSFADDDKSGPDPNRVGGLTHYLLQDEGDFSTNIGDSELGQGLANLQRSLNNNHKSKLSSAINIINSQSKNLTIGKDVKNTAGEIFKDAMEFVGNKKTRVLAATCVYIAAKACHQNRPLKEICEEFSADKASVRKMHSDIKKLQAQGKITIAMGDKQSGSTAEIYAERYLRQLNLSVSMINGLKQIVQNIEKSSIMSGKQPASIASVALYLACQAQSDANRRRSINEIAAQARISPNTIASAWKKILYPKRLEMLPQDFGDRLRVETLSFKTNGNE